MQMLNNGHIRDSTGLNFPGSNANNTEDWFTGEAHNPQGAFVTSRKKLLEAFYQKLSKQNPSFFRHERTKMFFHVR